VVMLISKLINSLVGRRLVSHTQRLCLSATVNGCVACDARLNPSPAVQVWLVLIASTTVGYGDRESSLLTTYWSEST